MSYKVWVGLEDYNEGTGVGEEMALDHPSLIDFETEEEARDFIDRMHASVENRSWPDFITPALPIPDPRQLHLPEPQDPHFL